MSELASSAENGASGLARRLRILGILAISIVAVGAPVLFSATLYTPDGMSRNGLVTHVLLPIVYVLIMLLIVLLAKRTQAAGKLDLVWWRRSRSEIAGILLLPVATLLPMALVLALVAGLGLKWKDDRAFSADGRGIVFFVALTVCFAVAAPILEEVFWRGYVQRALERVTRPFLAVVTQAVLFTAVHSRPLGGLAPIFVLGLVAGAWRWRRRTLVPIIATHIVLSGLYCAAHGPHWLDCTRIKITTDYVEQMAKAVRPIDYDPSADARICYEEGFQAVAKMPEILGAYRRGSPRDWPEEVFDKFRKWVEANDTALEHMAEGTRRPYFCPVYSGPTALLAGMPEAAGIRHLAFVIDARIKLRAFDGQDVLLLSDVATLYRFARHFAGTKVLTHQLIDVSIRSLLAGTLRGILAYESVPAQTLTALQRQLEQFRDSDQSALDFTIERLVWLDGIQRIFTDEGNGDGRVPRAVLTGWQKMPEPLRVVIDPMTPEQNAALVTLSRRETTWCAEEFLRLIPSTAGKTPWALQREPNSVRGALQNLIRENTYVGLLGTPSLRAIDLPWRATAELDALVATIAAIRYEMEQDEYPDSLVQLVETGYLQRMPRDPYADGPLIYSRVGGGFVLYSCGQDFDDDGGVPSRWGDGPDGGDQVFWPIR